MRSSVRNKLSDLKVIVIDEISMVSNDLLFHVYLRVTKIFEYVNNQPFASVSVITVGDFFSFHQEEEKQYMQIVKITGKILIHYGNSLKFLN